jgi:hypothetical protein
LLTRFATFDRQQETRRRNFIKLRELLQEVNCVEPLAIHPCVQKHGMYMFSMRYKNERCGGLPVDEFLEVCGAEGAPIHRGYSCTIADQPAIKKLLAKHPDFIRLMPTPVADEAVKEMVYIPHEVFMGNENDMSDIAAGLRKVEKYYADRVSAPSCRQPERYPNAKTSVV